MSLQAVLTTLFLPPLLLLLAVVPLGLLAWRGRRWAGLAAALAALLVLALATPLVAGALMVSLEATVARPGALPQGCEGPGAIIVLAAEVARGRHGLEVGPLSLERLRAAAALHKRTGLPVLLTGGPSGRGEIPLAYTMQRSLAQDFGVASRWIEPRAADTAQNAAYASAMLRAEGICAAYVVTHAWHLPRALEAFARQPGPVALPAPVRFRRRPEGKQLGDYVPRPDQLAESWYAIREWVGRAVYAIRD
jgi:uncharacterized SAM-binding protein YcdF (DUF218 family)